MLLPAAVNTGLILSLLRTQLTDNNLDAYLIPYGGSHYNAQASCDARIRFVSGFSGSAGTVIVSKDKALLWTDGRYFLQAEQTLYPNWDLMKQGEPGVLTELEWLRANIAPNRLVGVAGSTYPKSSFDSMRQSLSAANITLISTPDNLVDNVWEDFPEDPRPPCPEEPVFDLPLEFSGKDTTEKLADVRQLIAAEGADLLLVSELDEVAWLLNLRGGDMNSSATFLGFILLSPTRLEVFLDEEKVDTAVQAKLDEYGAQRFNYDQVTQHLTDQAETATKVWLSKFVNAKLADSVVAAKQLIKLSPVILMKSKKNAVEVQGMINAHLRDSAAIVALQSWLEAELNNGVTTISEISAADKLWDIRRNGEHFMGQSFPTIAGFGSNGAIIHYRATAETNKNVNKDSLFLLDSGGLYKDGTCDITRTMHFGTPSAEQKDRYTRVLKGHISVATSIFPNKTPGRVLDSYARKFLWDIGLEYKHGTGHGIGHFLNVHEGPQNIGGYSADDSGLEENMFTSNEPGYYKDGEYGIRIENIVRYVKAESYDGFLKIETVSFVPLHKNLIDVNLLTDEELAWVNAYHAQVREKVGEYIDDHPDYLGPEVRAYLERETVPLVREVEPTTTTAGTTTTDSEVEPTTTTAGTTTTDSEVEPTTDSGTTKVATYFSSITLAIFAVFVCAF